MTENFSYLPHTEKDRDDMLLSCGVKSFEDLVAHIPAVLRIKELDIPSGLSELELNACVNKLASKNLPVSKQISFLGGGAYRRFVPAALAAIVSRSEFATAYTPYQPEVSQGTLQAIYEFQTAVCLLTGMEVANASVYDGPTACAEAALMASRLTQKTKIQVAQNLNPEYAAVTRTYTKAGNLTTENIPASNGVINWQNLQVGQETAAVIVQYPNYFGCLEDLAGLAEIVHKSDALLIVVVDPISLGLLCPPGSSGADIVVGDAQQCGNYLSFGGPSAGFMATRSKYLRQLPGRLAGMTVDNRGQRAFTLTLQTREQHIRRAKATSNICTNQALNALSMLVYLTLLGPQGLKEVAQMSFVRAHKLVELMTALPGVRLKFKQEYFNEFVIETDFPASYVLAELQARGILGGLGLGSFCPGLANSFLVAVTEMNGCEELESYAHTLKDILTKGVSKGSCAQTNLVNCF